MKSKSDRLPKFKPMPVSGAPVQTNPLVWVPKLHGVPYWFNFKNWLSTPFLTPFLTPHAIAEAAHDANGPFSVMDQIVPAQWEIIELRARANPWHPSGRLDRLVLKKWTSGKLTAKRFTVITLKFNGDGEQVECIGAHTIMDQPTITAPVASDAKYKGPRQAGDTKSAVSGNTRKRS